MILAFPTHQRTPARQTPIDDSGFSKIIRSAAVENLGQGQPNTKSSDPRLQKIWTRANRTQNHQIRGCRKSGPGPTEHKIIRSAAVENLGQGQPNTKSSDPRLQKIWARANRTPNHQIRGCRKSGPGPTEHQIIRSAAVENLDQGQPNTKSSDPRLQKIWTRANRTQNHQIRGCRKSGPGPTEHKIIRSAAVENLGQGQPNTKSSDPRLQKIWTRANRTQNHQIRGCRKSGPEPTEHKIIRSAAVENLGQGQSNTKSSDPRLQKIWTRANRTQNHQIRGCRKSGPGPTEHKIIRSAAVENLGQGQPNTKSSDPRLQKIWTRANRTQNHQIRGCRKEPPRVKLLSMILAFPAHQRTPARQTPINDSGFSGSSKNPRASNSYQ
jgi:hypothetical protein